FATNMEGVLNTVLPAMQVMRAQPVGEDGVRGRIAAVASIAAFIPASPAPSYCASKAAVDSWMVATARSSRAQGIRLTSVCPGFIRTPMTEGKRRWMPGLMAPDRAARIILRGIAAGRVRVAFPWWLMAACRLAALLPPRVFGTLAAPRSTKA
ncbi:MAG TPA: SDR family NAD(P)-dependent oxidoreductase, partial [Acetobacteraceae bacterium]